MCLLAHVTHIVTEFFLLTVDAADGINEKTSLTPRFDTSKSSAVFGVKYRTMEETTKDMLNDFKARGW
jgi:hypothetical protein